MNEWYHWKRLHLTDKLETLDPRRDHLFSSHFNALISCFSFALYFPCAFCLVCLLYFFITITTLSFYLCYFAMLLLLEKYIRSSSSIIIIIIILLLNLSSLSLTLSIIFFLFYFISTHHLSKLLRNLPSK